MRRSLSVPKPNSYDYEKEINIRLYFVQNMKAIPK